MKVYEITVENTHIFYGYITENDIDIRDNRLSQYRKNKVKNLKDVNSQKLSLLAETLLLYGMDSLGVKYDIPLEFAFNNHGKAFVKGRDDLFFNLSHSGDMAVCAISDNTVGVDVEKITRNCDSAVEKYYTVREKDLSADKGSSYIWTRKEAVAKANGRGIGIGIGKVDTSGDCVNIEDEEYKIFTCSVDGYYISVAYR